MKMFVPFVIFFWLPCGFNGAWWLDPPGDIARGPISLVKAINEKPMTYPGPD